MMVTDKWMTMIGTKMGKKSIAVTVSLALMHANMGFAAGLCDDMEGAPTKVIRLGVSAASEPFSFQSGSTYSGYMVDLCKRSILSGSQTLCDTNVDFSYTEINGADQFQILAESKIDIICSSVTHTISRRIQQNVQFSSTVFVTGADFLSRPEVRIKRLRDLAGLRVSVVGNTTTQAGLLSSIQGRMMSEQVQITTVDSHQEGVERLISRSVDVHVGDQALLIPFLDKNPRLRLSGRLHSFEPYAFVVPQGSPLLNIVDQGISETFRNGSIWELFDKYFPESEPSSLLISVFILGGIPE
jgi:ABC-type amino acid transport substrate-binding protein